jgi:hypothetical protein
MSDISDKLLQKQKELEETSRALRSDPRTNPIGSIASNINLTSPSTTEWVHPGGDYASLEIDTSLTSPSNGDTSDTETNVGSRDATHSVHDSDTEVQLVSPLEGSSVSMPPSSPCTHESTKPNASLLALCDKVATTLAPDYGEDFPDASLADFNMDDLSQMIDAERRISKKLPYTRKHTDYNGLQSAVDECIAIAEIEHITAPEVAVRALRNFFASKDSWVNNTGFPIKAFLGDVGKWFRPPVIVKADKPKPTFGPESEGTGDAKKIYDARTREAMQRERETDDALAKEGPADVGTEIAEIMNKLKSKKRLEIKK